MTLDAKQHSAFGGSNEDLIAHGQGVVVAALESGATTSEIELIPAGEFTLADGRGTFTMPDPAEFITNSMAYAAARSGGELLVDFDHGSERKGVDEKQTAAAGWITSLRHNQAAGRIMATVRWTAQGREALVGRAYRFISPVFAHTKDNRLLGVVRAGLTNVPAISDLKAVAASREENIMNALLVAIAKALGLDDETDEAKIKAAAIEQLGKVQTAEAVLKAAGVEGELDDTAISALAAKLTAAASAGDAPDPSKFVPIDMFNETATQVASLTERLASRDADDLVAAAQAEGKITPASMGWAKDYAAANPEGFATWAKGAPIVCSGDELLPALRPPSEGEEGLSAADLAVCSVLEQHGISKDSFKKTRGNEAVEKGA
jgi:phage I-like protein